MVWVGIPLLLLVVGAAVFCLFYIRIRDAKNRTSSKTYRQCSELAVPTRVLQSAERERWGQPKSMYRGSIQDDETVQLFRDIGFSESASRAGAEVLEREMQRKIRNSAW